MRKSLILLLIFLASSHSYASNGIEGIELEGRTGISASGIWGLHTGAYLGVPLSSLFAIRPALLLHTVEWCSYRPADGWRIGLIVPVYGSFRFPLSEKTNLRTDIGPYFGVGDDAHLGGAAEVGVEIRRFYIGVGYFQNAIGNSDNQLNFSVGYQFVL